MFSDYNNTGESAGNRGNEPMIQTVGIIGMGAIGILFGIQFQKTLGKEHVFIIADRERIERYKREGVYANGEFCDFQYTEAEEAPRVDLLIFATKYHGLTAAIENAQKACGEETIVMSFLNGISSEQVLEERLHPSHLLYCTVQGMDATKTGNQMTYTKTGSVAFGEKDNTESENVHLVKAFFQRTGIAYSIPENMIHQQWSKWMLNVGVNQACAVYGVSYSGVQREGEPRNAMIAAMKEAQSVARAEGIELTERELNEWIDLVDSLSAGGEPSMRQDTRAGRKTEVELFSGMVCMLGKKHKIATPRNDFFYEVLAGFSDNQMKRCESKE